MAGSFSDTVEASALEHLLKISTWTAPANIYIELYTVAPTDSGGGTPCSGGNYARALCNTWTRSGTSPTNCSNTSTVTFNQASAGWGTVVAFALFDAITAGTFLVWGDVAPTKLIETNDTPRFLAGELDVNLD